MTATGSGAGGAAGRAPAADQVRNVVLVGHSGSGKSSLVEALLAATGTIQRPGSIEEGTTVSDFDEVEVRQQRSVNLTLEPVVHNGIKVNLLDAPGYADFTGDLRAGLRAADSALFAVSATDGIDGVTQMLWEECAAVDMPRAVVITKIDHQRADFDATLAACRAAFGDAVAPLYLPVGAPVNGLIGLLSEKLYTYSGGARTEGTPAAGDADRMAELRGELIEGIITESEDESLMDRYLSGEDIDPKVLIEDLEKAVARGSFYPVLATSSPQQIGMLELLEVMTQAFPSPAEHPLPAVTTPDGKPVSGLTSRPHGPAARRGRQDHLRPVRRPDQPGPRVLRHAAPRRLRARVRARARRARARGPRQRRADRRADLAARQAAAAGHAVRGRRHLRGRQAGHRRDRRHAV